MSKVSNIRIVQHIVFGKVHNFSIVELLRQRLSKGGRVLFKVCICPLNGAECIEVQIS